MAQSTNFDDFLTAFFGIFTQNSFRKADFLAYLHRSSSQRSGDEASVVDNAIVSPLLGILGFPRGEQAYNRQDKSNRPDFAPEDAVYGTCFIVENKNTAIDLTFDINNPDSHLSQLTRYTSAAAVRLGWLTNGRQLTVWRFDDNRNPSKIIDLDIPAAIAQWNNGGASALSDHTKTSLRDLYDLCRKESFTNLERLEAEIAIDLAQWQQQALVLGNGGNGETVLVEALQSLVLELQQDARRRLETHFTRYNQYLERGNRLLDNSQDTATQELEELRRRIFEVLNRIDPILNLEPQERENITSILTRAEQNARAFVSPKDMLAEVLKILNQALARKHANQPKSAKPQDKISDIDPSLHDNLEKYANQVFRWHQRQATLRQEYQKDIAVHDNYTVWLALVQETMLGGLNETQCQNEFALQAAYVVFIRLLLIRVCEDKEIFPNRFVSDGGIKHWQEDIQRYWVFATGNPYSPLLDMAYRNAQNIYAHFFTGRELFNWYELDKQQLIMTLHQLSRFNFAGVDSDIVGTVYNTYVNRKEKREKGQYYTPPEIVNYILDEVGYTSGTAIIGDKKRLIDPACGSGSFLVAAAKRLVAAYKGNAQQIEDPAAVLQRVQNNLYGFDLNPFACYLAEVNLLIQVLDLVKLAYEKGQPQPIQRFHIYNVDALARPTGTYRYALFNTLIAEESDQVDQIKSRAPNTPYADGFAFVVANPPYGAKLSDAYKDILRADYADVFYGQPDTYVFFLKLGIELLATNGKLGFITPNTYLMGANAVPLRRELMSAGRINQIVDLPQGIWLDANVDCVLLFLTYESDQEFRKSQQVQINLLGVDDTLDRLIAKNWSETLVQQQSKWMEHERYEIDIRFDALIDQIEQACQITINTNGNSTKIQRLEDVTDSSPGLKPYGTKTDSQANLYVRPRRDVPYNEGNWQPFLDGSSFVGRYELRWGILQPHINYGAWLDRPRKSKYFDEPKIILVRLRNKALKRRLVATYDDTGYYNRDNYNNIIATGNGTYELKYILAIFNSALLNYWYSRKFDNVNINPATFRQLPIYPADAQTQAEFVELVDKILARHATINQLREQGYTIKHKRDGSKVIEVPYNHLLAEIQQANPNFSTLSLFDAKAAQLFTIPESCDIQETISSNVFIPPKYPNTVVLRRDKLWLEVPDEDVRIFIQGYLKSPLWQGKNWAEIKNIAQIPAEVSDRSFFFAKEAQKKAEIQTLLDEVAQIDAEIDKKVLDLYGITNPADRQRILGSAPMLEEEEENEDSTAAENGQDEANSELE
ncbi:N-6 DNA methylase [Anabaena azotica]|uniref:N-6 DNA methylase n=1 Tax=Anabaena azotica FACHB-119 TaxID=947527 RepID=A0ABR8DAZ5_9NOST|nr:N-6 DNA methylase [Anabaena azotica]MBD2503316.1 N-6 DNA methylase [Anabaena azotica FACHB-119]